MPYTRKHPFDEKVVARINDYIRYYNFSLRKIAEKSGMTYQQLYYLLNNKQVIKLHDYVRLCEAFDEPFNKFL